MFGRGLLKGMAITWKEFRTKKFTVQYPEQQHPKPERFHGRFTLDVDKCIACNLCANACPNKVIKITAEKVEKKRVLTRYEMHIEYCLFCGFCVEACNKNAIRFTSEHDMSQYYYDRIPLVLVDREAPRPEPKPDDGEDGDKVKNRAKDADKKENTKETPAASRSAADKVVAGKAPDKEGQ